mmetsp:Transcript_18044/g.30859  ORF Transcript_18044/g.30859 Transcript_18044/m.30859 type:complete len:114 (+) Transcript_18044:116-457(+)|eukprot:CAMPEP_0119110486 /NCGR_PEP_ID=MMETSP1180-20130426/30058_1 /TAXON_ID=3052 ORGANISM="Chlamydomonas cf sp, Strain CCMP681" /NCGR_SAMPLE_ID=MMETSP1180 /ASSEMBLY_ACC=CAM_ASM_000741 /LENGTH=113 /DNA_ID=CAMNT_0007096849 /DNA_START=15 /DNA_END=356 /DNA_ORIENTATION=+
MAAYGGHNDATGLQIFVTVRRGSEYPPRTCDIRVRYEEPLKALKDRAAKALDVPLESLQLFRHKRELTTVYDTKTMLELDIHTGCGIQGWDTRDPPNYWPPVRATPEGLVIEC